MAGILFLRFLWAGNFFETVVFVIAPAVFLYFSVSAGAASLAPGPVGLARDWVCNATWWQHGFLLLLLEMALRVIELK
jgi:hypothetical protein